MTTLEGFQRRSLLNLDTLTAEWTRFHLLQNLARLYDPAVPQFNVIPNTPAEAGGRGTLRQLANSVQFAGLHPAQAASPIPSTPLQKRTRNVRSLSCALKRARSG